LKGLPLKASSLFNKLIFVWIFAGILTVVCTVKNPAEGETITFFLSNLTLPDTLYLQSDNNYVYSVKANHSEGVEAIQTVKSCITQIDNQTILQEDTLQDDGSNGDIIPKDGIFSGRCSLSLIFEQNLTGTYRIHIIGEDVYQNVSDTLSSTITLVEGSRKGPPRILQYSIPDTLISDSLDYVIVWIETEDPQGLEDIDSVFFDIFLPLSPVPHFQSELWDNGQSGDLIEGDGIFTFQGDLRDTLKSRGIHTFRFQAADRSGLFSNPHVKEVFIDQINHPPVLSNVMAPDTISRNIDNTFLITVDVFDHQGLSDVKMVYFNSTKPDSTPATGNPFLLYDDESHGDLISDDGTYSLIVMITTEDKLGTYRFDFYAEDYSGAVSDSYAHFIIVVD
jgi:hypothetical protein